MKTLYIAAVAAAVTIGSLGVQAQGYDSAKNQPSYWGNNCYKIETGLGVTYSAPAGATKVVVKGGTDNAVYTSGAFTNLTAPINPNNGKPYGISHVIVCTDEVKTAPVTPQTPAKPVVEDKPVVNEDKPVVVEYKPAVTPGKGAVADTPKAKTPAPVSQPKTDVQAGAGAVVTELPATGISIVNLLGTVTAGAATYLIALKRKG